MVRLLTYVLHVSA